MEFGSPLGWTQEFINTVPDMDGWDFILFTPNQYQSKDHFKVIPMTVEDFNVLVEAKLGINPKMYITPGGLPSFHITDFHIMVGKIFEDYLKEYDFWGIIGNDCVVGRLDHFVTDSLLDDYDIWNDDIGQFNAHFSLWRNTEVVNTLFMSIPDWQLAVNQPPCPGCNGIGQHRLFVTDEIGMTKVLETTDLRYGHPKYYLLHGHDRLENHVPKAKLEIKDDGSLWELLADTQPGYGRRWPFFGHEIAYYHFSSTKKWPL